MTSNKQTKLAHLARQDSEVSQSKKKAAVKYSYNRNKDKGPKRNKSAFVIFSNMTRLKLKEQGHESENANDMMIKLAGMWKNLSKEEKKPYEEEARNDKIRYYQELESYWKENPSRTITNKTKNNHVKKPSSAYGLFLKDVKDEVKAQNPSVKMAEIMKLVSNRWKTLDRATRAFYQEKAKKEKEEAKKRLNEHYSRNENAEEETLKKRIEKWSWIKRKMKDLPKAINSDQENFECELKLESPETSSDSNESAQNDNLIVKLPASSDLSTVSDLEQVNLVNKCPSTMESSLMRTESIPNPKEEFDTVKVENIPEIIEKDFIAAMLSFDCGFEMKDDDVDFSGKRAVKVESSPFIQALELEIPGLDCTASRALFNRTIQNILDYDNSETWGALRNINTFTNTSSRKLSWNQY